MDIAGQYFDCLCRTCMTELCEASSYDGKTKPQQQWQSLFDRINEECGALRIAELLTNAVPQIEVQLSDELPKKICCKCLQQLFSVHRFQQMCLQSDQQLRQRVPKKQKHPSIPVAAMEGDPLGSSQSSSTHRNIENSSVQEPLETAEQEVKPEVTEANDVDIDQLLEDCRDSQGNLSEFIKNEPIEDNDQQLQKQNEEPYMEDNDDGDTIQSIISGKDAVMAIESEAQQENEPNVKKDQRRHGEDKSNECPYCPRSFDSKRNMYKHKELHEGVKKVPCDVCGKSFRKWNLKTHKLTHSREKVHKCGFCEKRFTQYSYLRSHIRRHTGEKPYKCKYCERSFTQCVERTKHTRIHLGANIYRCELCPLAFPAAKELLVHFTTHKGEDSETRERNMKALQEAEAKLLPQSYKQQSKIKANEKVKKQHSKHGEDKPYECPYCPRRFKAKSNVLVHQKVHEEENQVACNICGKRVRMEYLEKHKLFHSDERAHKCDFCGKRFVQKSHLRLHIRKHTGEKPHKCKYCDLSFSYSGYRITHMRLHFGRNVYRCKLCPSAFPAPSELRKHLTTHKNEDSETHERNLKALQEAEAKIQLEWSEKETQLKEQSEVSKEQPQSLKEKSQSPEKQSQQKIEIKAKRNEQKDHIRHGEDKTYECPYCARIFNSKRYMLQHKAIHEGVKQVPCDVCGKSFRKMHLKTHKLTHRNEQVHKCGICEKSFNRITSLRDHICTHTGEKPYKCKYCKCSYTTASALMFHMRRHLGANVYRCELCPLAFPVASELNAHLTEHENEDSETRERNMKALKEAEAKLQLELSKNEMQQPSNEQSQQQSEMPVQKDHSTHGEDQPYKCSYCPLSFTVQSTLNLHKSVHEGEKQVACDVCGKIVTKNCFKQHQLTHNNEKTYKCHLCEKSFNLISYLRNHIRTHTGEKPYKCKYCDRSFTRACHRATHMRIHYRENVHRCELCPLAFSAAKELRVHFATHKDEDSETRERNMKALKEAQATLQLEFSKNETQQPPQEQSQQQSEMNVQKDHIAQDEDNPYECTYCPRRFTTYSNMHRHKAIHEGIDREACDICGKSVAKRHLKNHRLTHSNEKPYECDFCGKRFNLVQYLRIHNRKHTGKKPYKCKYCERSFSDATARRKHIRIHLGDNTHRCELCPLAFSAAKELRLHFTVHKDEDSETRERNMKALKEAEAKLLLKLSENETQQPSKERTK